MRSHQVQAKPFQNSQRIPDTVSLGTSKNVLPKDEAPLNLLLLGHWLQRAVSLQGPVSPGSSHAVSFHQNATPSPNNRYTLLPRGPQADGEIDKPPPSSKPGPAQHAVA